MEPKNNENAFVRAFRAEMAEAIHQSLIETYTWANRQGYGDDEELNQRAETWANNIEAKGKAAEVLDVLAHDETVSRLRTGQSTALDIPGG